MPPISPLKTPASPKPDAYLSNCNSTSLTQCAKHKNPEFCKLYITTLCLRKTYVYAKSLLNNCRGDHNCISNATATSQKYLMKFKENQIKLKQMAKVIKHQQRAAIKSRYSNTPNKETAMLENYLKTLR